MESIFLTEGHTVLLDIQKTNAVIRKRHRHKIFFLERSYLYMFKILKKSCSCEMACLTETLKDFKQDILIHRNFRRR
jgi:DNA-binding HxlR family transcriptional regulator